MNHTRLLITTAAVIGSSMLFAACSGSANQTATTSTDLGVATPIPTLAPTPMASTAPDQTSASPQSMAPNTDTNDPVLKASALSGGSDTKSLDADLKSTTIATEQFN